MSRPSAEEIVRALSKYRPLKQLVKDVGPPPPRPVRAVATRYPTLVRSIVFQQLAGKAASAIHGRLEAALEGVVEPERMLLLSDAQCKEAGLSGAKRDALRDLSAKSLDGTVQFARHGRRSDEQIIKELVQVRGVGPWTVQMYLMHNLGRHDVWPVLDYGVRAGWAQLHGLEDLLSPKEMLPVADHLAPFRSDVAWYCWQAADRAKAAKR